MTKTNNPGERAGTSDALALVRQRIDAVDDQLLDMLAQRFRLVDEVRAAKLNQSPDVYSPLRPAREAEVLRRLTAKASALGVRPELLVCLWPAIFSVASLRQGMVKLHVSVDIGEAMHDVQGAFPLMAATVHADVAAAVRAVDDGPGHLAVVATASAWLPAFVARRDKAAQVIAALPFLATELQPACLVIGHAPEQATGDDETLTASRSNALSSSDASVRWSQDAGEWSVVAYAGFLMQPPEGDILLGRYPAPMRAMMRDTK